MKEFYKNDGFTLIEMMVAAAVSSVILLMVYTAYSSIIKSVNQSKIISVYFENINLVIRRIDSDLLNSYWNINSKNINFIASLEGASSRLNFVTGDYKSNRMIMSIKDSFPASDLHEVGYYLKIDSKTGKNNLIRRSQIHYDDSPLEGGVEEVILNNVDSIKFEFKTKDETSNTWDSREKKAIPGGIKTTLIVNDPNMKKDLYEFFTICNLSYE